MLRYELHHLHKVIIQLILAEGDGYRYTRGYARISKNSGK